MEIAGAPEGVIAVEAVGEVEAADYESVLRPAIERAVEERGEIRLVYELGEQFTGYSPGAMWADTKLGLGALGVGSFREWHRVAVVTDRDWIRHAVQAFTFLMPGEVRVFPEEGVNDALMWAAADGDR